MERLAADPLYFAKPDRALFQDIRRYFPITVQAQVAWAVQEGVSAAVAFIEEQIEAGALDGGVARCRATTRKGKPCQRTPLPERDYCPSHQHLERARRSRRRRRSLESIGRRPVARHRQADPPALARRLPDGGAAAADRARRQVERRGLLGDVGRGVRAPLLLRPRRAARARRAAPLAARRVHRRGALHAPLGALLPPAARARRRRARGAPDRALPARGQVRLRRAAAARAPEPRARPPRLRRGADRDRRCASRCATPTTRPRCRAGSRSSRARSRSSARSSSATGRSRATRTRERTLNPYALLRDRGAWYVVGHDLDREDIRTFRVSRIRGDIRFATRRERDFRIPADFDIDDYRGRPDWQFGDAPARRGSRSAPTPPGGCERAFGDRGRVEDGVFVTEYASLDAARLAGCSARTAARCRSSPTSSARGRAAPRAGPRARTRARRRSRPRRAAGANAATTGERPAGPVAPERFGVLQALLAYLLAALRRGRRGRDPRATSSSSASTSREDQLEEHLSLLNLVNFGGGCYAVYAELHGDEVHVDKELYGDTFRAPPRLTPLEARAIRLALEFVGPMIAAEAHTPLDRVRRKLEETFGQFELAQTPEPRGRRRRGGARRDALRRRSASGGSSRSST